MPRDVGDLFKIVGCLIISFDGCFLFMIVRVMKRVEGCTYTMSAIIDPDLGNLHSIVAEREMGICRPSRNRMRTRVFVLQDVFEAQRNLRKDYKSPFRFKSADNSGQVPVRAL